jgi:hypothetical protein
MRGLSRSYFPLLLQHKSLFSCHALAISMYLFVATKLRVFINHLLVAHDTLILAPKFYQSRYLQFNSCTEKGEQSSNEISGHLPPYVEHVRSEDHGKGLGCQDANRNTRGLLLQADSHVSEKVGYKLVVANSQAVY